MYAFLFDVIFLNCFLNKKYKILAISAFFIFGTLFEENVKEKKNKVFKKLTFFICNTISLKRKSWHLQTV